MAWEYDDWSADEKVICGLCNETVYDMAVCGADGHACHYGCVATWQDVQLCIRHERRARQYEHVLRFMAARKLCAVTPTPGVYVSYGGP